MMNRAVALLASLVMAAATAAQAADTPPEVASFAKAVLKSCETLGGHPGSGVAMSTDLNGDRSPEWVVADGGPMCPGVRAPASRPFIVTIFVADKPGHARPAFQRGVYGYRLERGVLWLASRGYDCGGANAKATCDRPVQWIATAKIFDLAPLASSRMPSTVLP